MINLMSTNCQKVLKAPLFNSEMEPQTINCEQVRLVSEKTVVLFASITITSHNFVLFFFPFYLFILFIHNGMPKQRYFRAVDKVRGYKMFSLTSTQLRAFCPKELLEDLSVTK